MESVEWNIKNYNDEDKGVVFYTIFFSLFAILLLFAFWQENFLFGIFVILAGGLLLFLSSQTSPSFTFRVDEKGFHIIESETFYPYSQINHFDIHEFDEKTSDLLFVFKGRLRPPLRARFYTHQRDEISSLLSSHIPQREIELSLTDSFSRFIGM